MEIVFFGQQRWELTWTEKQQLATRLARRGHRVLYVDPEFRYEPLACREILPALWPARSGFGLRRPGPEGLAVFRYAYLRPLRRLNGVRYPRVVRAVARRAGLRAPVAVAFTPDALEAVRALRPAATVYYAVDEWTGFVGGPDTPEGRRLRGREEALLRLADVALGVSPRLVERFRALRPRSYLLENGADVDALSPERLASAAPLAEIAALPRPRLGLLGRIDERVDTALLAEVAARRPGWQVVLVGRVADGVDGAGLRALPNVHAVGFQPHERLASVLRGFDVALVPYRRNDLTHACNPAKVYEYLAAGLPVVATPLEGIVGCRALVELAEGGDAFVAAVERALADGDRGRAARMAHAAANGWEQRTDAFERHLREALTAAASRGAAAGRAA